MGIFHVVSHSFSHVAISSSASLDVEQRSLRSLMLGRRQCSSSIELLFDSLVAAHRPASRRLAFTRCRTTSSVQLSTQASYSHSYSTSASTPALIPLLQLPFLAPRFAISTLLTSSTSRTHMVASAFSIPAQRDTHAGSPALWARTHSTKAKVKSASASPSSNVHEHGSNGEHEHEHTHSHSVFGHSHAHEDGDAHGTTAESVIKVIEGKGDRGTRITLIGLVVNVGLTASKGAAGWFMNSAALLAEAGHSASGAHFLLYFID